MILIVAKFPVRPESSEEWSHLAKEFTEATRAEPGCLWFDWSRSTDDPNEYMLVEAFEDAAAGATHVKSAHFKQAQKTLPAHLERTPEIIHINHDGLSGWAELGEFAVDAS